MQLDRRSFLFGVAGVTALLTLPGRALAGDVPVFHVVYPTPPQSSREDAQDLLERIAGALGPAVAAHLLVARRGGSFVVIYDRTGVKDPTSKALADQVAARHDALLRDAFDEARTFAAVVSSSELEDAWNVRYGDPGSEAALKRRFDDVVRMLGPGVAKALAIEKIGGDLHQLVYRRLGDRSSTESVAARHGKLLAGLHLPVTAVPDQFREIRYDASSADPTSTTRLAEPRATAAATDPVVDEELRTELPRVEDMLGDDDTTGQPAACVDEDTADTAEPEEPTPVVVTTPARPAPGALKAQIADLVRKLREQGAISDIERTSWVVHDLLTDETLADINGDVPLQTASMIKPYVALAFLHQVQKGKLIYGEESTRQMERMIQVSDNDATNWVIDAVGGPATVQELLKKHYGAICRDLTLVECIPDGGCTYLNKASANDHKRLLRAIWNDEVPYASEIRRLMNLPGTDRLYFNVPEIPAGTEVYNKTGTTSMCCGDMGILVARRTDEARVPYIIVGVIERASRTSQYTSWSRGRANVIRRVSGVTYTYMQQLYGLKPATPAAT